MKVPGFESSRNLKVFRTKFSSVALRKLWKVTLTSLSKADLFCSCKWIPRAQFLGKLPASQNSCLLSFLQWINNMHHQRKTAFSIELETAKWGTVMMDAIKTKTADVQGQGKVSTVKVSSFMGCEKHFLFSCHLYTPRGVDLYPKIIPIVWN